MQQRLNPLSHAFKQCDSERLFELLKLLLRSVRLLAVQVFHKFQKLLIVIWHTLVEVRSRRRKQVTTSPLQITGIWDAIRTLNARNNPWCSLEGPTRFQGSLVTHDASDLRPEKHSCAVNLQRQAVAEIVRCSVKRLNNLLKDLSDSSTDLFQDRWTNASDVQPKLLAT